MKLIWHPRTLFYLAVWSGIGFALLFLLGTREHMGVSVAKDRNPRFMLMSDGSVRNGYTLKLRNMQGRPRTMEITLSGLPDGQMWTDDMSRDKASRRLVRTVDPDSTQPVRVYVVAPPSTQRQDVTFTLRALDKEGGTDSDKTHFDAPGEDE